MSDNFHHPFHHRQPVLGLLVGVIVLAALAAQPLHLMEGHGDVVPSVSPEAEAHATFDAAFEGTPSIPGEAPFSTGHGTCLDCLALNLSAATGAWVAVPVALSPVPSASPPSPRLPMEFRGKADARPRAPPST